MHIIYMYMYIVQVLGSGNDNTGDTCMTSQKDIT